MDKTTEKRAITDLNLPNVAVEWEIWVNIGGPVHRLAHGGMFSISRIEPTLRNLNRVSLPAKVEEHTVLNIKIRS